MVVPAVAAAVQAAMEVLLPVVVQRKQDQAVMVLLLQSQVQQ
jgi:hypothetical protein